MKTEVESLRASRTEIETELKILEIVKANYNLLPLDIKLNKLEQRTLLNECELY